jgi:hypothetical protein
MAQKHPLPAQRLKAGDRGRQTGQQRISEIGKDCSRHVDRFDCLEQAENQSGKNDSNDRRDDAHLDVGGRTAPETKPARYESKANQTAERQHRDDVDSARQYEFCQHIGDAERSARGNTGSEPVHAVAERGGAHSPSNIVRRGGLSAE